MWRSFFLAIGISLCIGGAECLVFDRAILASRSAPTVATSPYGNTHTTPSISKRIIKPPEWAPWSLMSAGAVVMLYSFTIPRRVGG